MKRPKVTMTYPATRKAEISHAIAAVAESRTRHLYRLAADTAPSELLVSAYLQGVTDAIDTLDKRDMLK